MPDFIVCPDQDKLSQLLHGTASIEEIESFAQHLETCSTCARRIEETDASPMMNVIRQPAQTAPLVVDGRMQAMMDQLDKMISRSGDPQQMTATPYPNSREAATSADGNDTGGDTEQDYLAYLEPAQASGELGRIGAYRVLKILGVGGMGVVYHAEDTTLHRPVALKAMKPSLASNKSARQRFVREAQAAAAVRHDHVVTIYQAGEQGPTAFLAMEYLEGESLEDRLKREGRLSIAETLRIGREIAEGLAAAHEHGLIHRDIKPANLWLEAKTGRVKVLDFGLARALALAGDQKLTQSGAVLGTPAYMAPEQADGRAVDARADLFSLGCVLYRMATGEMPFKGDGVMQILRAIELTEPTVPSQVNTEISRELSELIMQLLAKRPSERLASADQVIQRLRAMETTRPTAAFVPASPAVSRPPRPKSRSRWPQLLAAAAGIAGILWLGQIVIRYTDEKGEKKELVLPKGAKDVEIVRPPTPALPTPAVPTGEPLSMQALVTRPAKLPGVASWTLETIGHRGSISSVAYSPDGKWLASAGDDGCLRIWEPDGSKLVRAYVDQPYGAQFGLDLVWAPDGTKLAMRASSDKLAIWDIVAGRQLHVLDYKGRLSWSADGKLLSGTKLYDPIAGTHLDTLEVAGVLSPDGKLLASVVSDSKLLLRKATNLELFGEVTMPKASNGRIIWSPDSKFAAIGVYGEKKFRVVNASTGKIVYETEGRSNLVWSPDSKQLAFGEDAVAGAGGYSTRISILDGATGKKLRDFEQLTPFNESATSLSWSRDGKLIAAGTNRGNIYIYDVSNGRYRHVVQGHDNLNVLNLTWLTDGKTLVSDWFQTNTEEINFWELASGRMTRAPSPGLINRVARSTDGKMDLRAGWAGKPGVSLFVLYETTTGKRLHKIIEANMNAHLVAAVAFSHDGKTIITGTGVGDKPVVKLWEASSGKLLKEFSVKGDIVTTVARSPDEKRFVASFWSDSSLFDAQSGKLIKGSLGSGPPAFSPDGKFLAFGGGQIYTADGQKLERTIPGFRTDGRPPAADSSPPAWSADSKLLASGTLDIRVWDAGNGQPVAVLVRLAHEKGLTINSQGHFRGSPTESAVLRELVYVVQTAQGQETLTPAEMTQKYGWKNDPAKVRLAP